MLHRHGHGHGRRRLHRHHHLHGLLLSRVHDLAAVASGRHHQRALSADETLRQPRHGPRVRRDGRSASARNDAVVAGRDSLGHADGEWSVYLHRHGDARRLQRHAHVQHLHSAGHCVVSPSQCAAAVIGQYDRAHARAWSGRLCDIERSKGMTAVKSAPNPEMTKCVICEREISKGTVECPHCKASQESTFCKVCYAKIPKLAKRCEHCHEYQFFWRRVVDIPQTTYTTLTALIAVIGLVITPASNYFNRHSNTKIAFVNADPDYIRADRSEEHT